MYIYIYCHPQTDCFVVSQLSSGGLTGYIYIYIYSRYNVSWYRKSSVWLDTRDASSWDQTPFNITPDLVSYRSANSAIYVNSRN